MFKEQKPNIEALVDELRAFYISCFDFNDDGHLSVYRWACEQYQLNKPKLPVIDFQAWADTRGVPEEDVVERLKLITCSDGLINKIVDYSLEENVKRKHQETLMRRFRDWLSEFSEASLLPMVADTVLNMKAQGVTQYSAYKLDSPLPFDVEEFLEYLSVKSKTYGDAKASKESLAVEFLMGNLAINLGTGKELDFTYEKINEFDPQEKRLHKKIYKPYEATQGHVAKEYTLYNKLSPDWFEMYIASVSV